MIRKTYALQVLRKLMDAVIILYQVSEEDIRGHSHKRKFVEPRHVFIALAVELLYPEYIEKITLGKFLNRDHSTVIHAEQNFNDLCTTEPEFKAKADQVRALMQTQLALQS